MKKKKMEDPVWQTNDINSRSSSPFSTNQLANKQRDGCGFCLPSVTMIDSPPLSTALPCRWDTGSPPFTEVEQHVGRGLS